MFFFPFYRAKSRNVIVIYSVMSMWDISEQYRTNSAMRSHTEQ